MPPSDVFRADSRQASFNKIQIQPMKLMTRQGYAKNGTGDEVGNSCSPQKILDAVMATELK